MKHLLAAGFLVGVAAAVAGVFLLAGLGAALLVGGVAVAGVCLVVDA